MVTLPKEVKRLRVCYMWARQTTWIIAGYPANDTAYRVLGYVGKNETFCQASIKHCNSRREAIGVLKRLFKVKRVIKDEGVPRQPEGWVTFDLK